MGGKQQEVLEEDTSLGKVVTGKVVTVKVVTGKVVTVQVVTDKVLPAQWPFQAELSEEER